MCRPTIIPPHTHLQHPSFLKKIMDSKNISTYTNLVLDDLLRLARLHPNLASLITTHQNDDEVKKYCLLILSSLKHIVERVGDLEAMELLGNTFDDVGSSLFSDVSDV